MVEAERLAKARADAREAFRRGLEAQRASNAEAAAKEYRTAISLDAELAGAYTNLGLALQTLGNSKEALEQAQRGLKLQEGKDSKKRGHAAAVVGHVAQASGDMNLAMASYQEALKWDAAQEGAAVALAGIQAQGGAADAALATLKAAEAAGAAGAALHVNMSVLLLQQKQPQAALEQAQAALRAQPDSLEAKIAVGYAQFALERWGDAAQALDEASRADTKDAELLVALGYAYGKLGRHQEALAAFDRALQLKSDHTGALHNRAVTLDKMGESDAAAAAFEKAVAAGGSKPLPATAMATQLKAAVEAAKAQKWDEARKLAEPVVTAEPKNAQARYVLGLAAFHTHDLKTAGEQEYQLTLIDSQRATALRRLLAKE